MDHQRTRSIGDYAIGARLGSGSFAVVWRASHRVSGHDVAVKEIDKKQLNPILSANLRKEISILGTIRHPNIIRLYDAFETPDRIYLILEYCDGGDLAQYLHRHGKVSELVARHFLKQLAAGLQVLQEKHVIHRDLKPQNLLLASNEETPVLKIGDFGFARSLNPNDMADTLCGSPLYMAPEIIQNRKYDAKADLWSVGAILFQLVTGRPPFQGNSQFQLFQNILRSTELQFPDGALETLHPNCVDLCRSLLRHNPVERLTFQEFFNHNFLQEPRLIADVDQSSLLPLTKLADEPSRDKSLQVHPDHLICSGLGNLKLAAQSATENKRQHGKDVEKSISSMDQPQVADCLESIEKDYVLVYRHVTSRENISYYLATSLQENSNVRVSVCGPQAEKNNNDDTLANASPSKEVDADSAHSMENTEVQESDPLKTSCNISASKELQSLSVLHPSTRLLLLRQYLQAVSELVDEKYKAEKYPEAFSLELVVLAAWKKSVEICGSWLASTSGNESPGSSDTPTDKSDFEGPYSASKWAEQGFISALDHGEKLSGHLKSLDAKAEMPDAMEIIFQKALALGTDGGVDEYMGNKAKAAASYSKALLLFSFVVGEATSLALTPPFTLTPANRQRIHSYMRNLQTHQSKLPT